MVDILSRLVSNYNVRKHQTISMRPIDVTSAIVDRLLTTVSRKDCRTRAIQSGEFGTREQIRTV